MEGVLAKSSSQAGARGRPWRAGLLALAMACGVPAAQAQYTMEFAQTYNAPASNFISNTFLNQQALINATRPQAGARAQASPKGPAGPQQQQQPALASPQVARSAAELAQAAPAPQRARLEKVYGDLMPGYHQLERKLGWPADDLAGAMAALLAGNYMAMTGTVLSDASVSAAGHQLRASASVQALVARLSPVERRRLYEQCAMLGTFMALANTTRQQQSAEVVSGLRASARANLHAVLGDAAEGLRFTDRGIQLR